MYSKHVKTLISAILKKFPTKKIFSLRLFDRNLTPSQIFFSCLLTQVLLLFKGVKGSLYAIVYKIKRKGDPPFPSFNGQLILSAVF